MYSEEVQRFNLNLFGQHKNAVAPSGLECVVMRESLLLKAMRESLLLVMEGVFTTEARESLLLNYGVHDLIQNLTSGKQWSLRRLCFLAGGSRKGPFHDSPRRFLCDKALLKGFCQPSPACTVMKELLKY